MEVLSSVRNPKVHLSVYKTLNIVLQLLYFPSKKYQDPINWKLTSITNNIRNYFVNCLLTYYGENRGRQHVIQYDVDSTVSCVAYHHWFQVEYIKWKKCFFETWYSCSFWGNSFLLKWTFRDTQAEIFSTLTPRKMNLRWIFLVVNGSFDLLAVDI